MWVDDGLGAVMASLEARGELDNTIVVITQDHGQISKDTVYEGGTRVLLAVRYPGVLPAGALGARFGSTSRVV